MPPADQMLLSSLAAKNAVYAPDKDFLVEQSRRCSFKQFNQRSDALASGLLAEGLQPGQRVAVINHNSIELVEAYFGIMKAGGVVLPLNVLLSPVEISGILQDAEPSFVLAEASYLSKLDLPYLNRAGAKVFLIGGGETEKSYESLLSRSEAAPPEPMVNDSDVAMLIYTSGTTGVPKGVMLTHRNLLCDAWATCVARRLGHDEISLVTAPLYQSGALGSMLGNVLRTNTVVLLNGFDPEKVLETIQRERVNNALLVPAMVIKLLQFPGLDQFDLSSMRTVIYGAAPMPVSVLKKVIARFGWDFMGAFGATETGPAYIAFLDREAHKLDGNPAKELRLASVGKEGINAQVRIFDEQDQPLPVGQVGEIVVRGPHIMKGYWKKPQETAEALRGGWYHTGDLGMMDQDGYIFIVGRKKDMIISGGFNVYPRDVENALIEHPAVCEAAVVGIPHDVWGETPRAYVVLHPGLPAPSADELMIFLRARLAPFKLPRGGFAFVPDLPRNASGKVLKRNLREQALKEVL